MSASGLKAAFVLTTRHVAEGRVEDGRGGLGPMANTPFPIPAHQTERADFRHSAFRLASSQGTRQSAVDLMSRDDTSRPAFALR
jgi:hypothetical protein